MMIVQDKKVIFNCNAVDDKE